MDFTVTSFDNLAYSNIKSGSLVSANGPESKKLKWCGSGFLKQDRTLNEDDFREFKLNETSEAQQQMLSFSSPYSQTVTWPYFQHISAPFGVRGSFLTSSQWIELEHQALIYKYITANVPVPSCLLNPIRKAFESACFSSFPGLKHSAFGWDDYHLGFSSTDPEPRRCRRTDGKKWQCARDAVADQKYCERHINRGRHRSRKPVEGQTGHSAATITTISGKMAPNDSAKLTPAARAGCVSNAFRLSHNQQVHSLEIGIPHIINVNRCVLQKENAKGPNGHKTTLSMATSGTSLKENQSTFSWPDHLDLQPDGTRLSISIPVVTSDFISPTLSPSKDELNEYRMDLGFGKIVPSTEENQIQANWIPISWEGGPLGEALNTTNNSSLESKNATALNLIESQDNRPPFCSADAIQQQLKDRLFKENDF